MKRVVVILLVLSAVITRSYAADDKNIIPAELKSATVYRSGAELLHTAKGLLKQGTSELVIEGVSSYIDVNSIQVNCPAPVTILGVEFSNNYLVTDIAIPAVKKLQDSIEKLNADVEKTDVAITTATELLSVLKANKEIKGTQTGLSVAELIKLMDYYKLKSNELQNELSALQNKKTKLEDAITRLTNQVTEEQKKNTKSGGRLILQLFNSIGGNYEFTISYITQNAFWTPYYDIKADDVKSPMKIVYKAKIVQTTGIDWKQVKLSLSTSTPTQYGNAPVLRSWFLAYINPVAVMNRSLSTTSNTIQSFDQALQGKAAGTQLSEVVVTGYGTTRLRGQASSVQTVGPLYIVNGAEMSSTDFSKIEPSGIKSTQVLQSSEATAIYGSRAAFGAVVVTLKEGLEDYVSVTDNELDLTYDIALPYDVPTNGKQQIATLKESTMNAMYKYYSVPKLDKDAFLLAEVSDWEQLNLLPGEANIIFEGTYIGKTFIDPSSTNDTLNLTLGKDKRVVVKREKLRDYSSAKFIGSNKVQTLSYELTVKNNKKDPVKFLLKDQYPISTNKEIEVQLLDDGGAMNNTEIGVLTWKLELAPGEVKKVRFSYSVKYPKGKQLNLN